MHFQRDSVQMHFLRIAGLTFSLLFQCVCASTLRMLLGRAEAILHFVATVRARFWLDFGVKSPTRREQAHWL